MKAMLWLLPIFFVATSSAQTRVTLTVTQRTVTEGQGGAGVVVVRRNQGTEDSLRVFYRSSGNARNGVDYERLDGSVEIPAGSAEATIEIVPIDDNTRERTERVTVQLRPAPRNSPPYRLGARRAQAIQILDDDQPSTPQPPQTPRPPPIAGRPPWFPIPGLITNPTNTTSTPTN